MTREVDERGGADQGAVERHPGGWALGAKSAPEVEMANQSQAASATGGWMQRKGPGKRFEGEGRQWERVKNSTK